MGTNILSWLKVIAIVIVLAIIAYTVYKFKALWQKYGISLFNPASHDNIFNQGVSSALTSALGREESAGTFAAEHLNSTTRAVEGINWSGGVSEEEKALYRKTFGPLPSDPDYKGSNTARTSEDGVQEPIYVVGA